MVSGIAALVTYLNGGVYNIVILMANAVTAAGICQHTITKTKQ
jgi:hypothetical protein